MLQRCMAILVVFLIGLLPACLSPVPHEDWPVKDDPLFRSAVWIRPPGKYGSGVILHSSERGTYILTAGHVVSDDGGFLFPDGEVRVGVYGISHAPATQEPYVMYSADIVAATSPRSSTDRDPSAGITAQIRWLAWDDLAILRLRTDRLFVATPLFAGPPETVCDKRAVLVPVVPKMYPHRQSAFCDADIVHCPDSVKGNSGAPVFVDGQVVGIVNAVCLGPGPKKIQDFIRKHDEIGFLLAHPSTAIGGAETPDSGSLRER
jgi:hypothetical protein